MNAPANLIDRAELDGGQYVHSLLTVAQERGLLSAGGSERIQGDFLALLAAQAERFTQGESTSVSTQTAGELLESILYTIGAGIKRLPPMQALAELECGGAARCFAQGQRVTARRLRVARLLYARLRGQLFETPNLYYRASAVDAVGGFFRVYRAELFAHRRHITADYPALLFKRNLAGVEFIENYLDCLLNENSFCRAFSPERVHRLMLGVSADYERTPLCIYEYVLAAALCCVLTGADPQELSCDADRAAALFEGRDVSQAQALLESALGELSLSGAVYRYALRSLPVIAASIVRHASLGRLCAYIPAPVFAGGAPRFIPDLDAHMPNADYARLLQRLVQSDSPERVRLAAGLACLGDLLDALRDGGFTPEETAMVLGGIPRAAAAVVLRAAEGEGGSTEQGARLFCESLPENERARLLAAARMVDFGG